MYALRLMPVPLKAYAAILATAGTLAFVSGAAINFVHARNNPGADPYMPRPEVIAPPEPAPPSSIIQEKVRVPPPPFPRGFLSGREAPGGIGHSLNISEKALKGLGSPLDRDGTIRGTAADRMPLTLPGSERAFAPPDDDHGVAAGAGGVRRRSVPAAPAGSLDEAIPPRAPRKVMPAVPAQ